MNVLNSKYDSRTFCGSLIGFFITMFHVHHMYCACATINRPDSKCDLFVSLVVVFCYQKAWSIADFRSKKGGTVKINCDSCTLQPNLTLAYGNAFALLAWIVQLETKLRLRTRLLHVFLLQFSLFLIVFIVTLCGWTSFGERPNSPEVSSCVCVKLFKSNCPPLSFVQSKLWVFCYLSVCKRVCCFFFFFFIIIFWIIFRPQTAIFLHVRHSNRSEQSRLEAEFSAI